MAEWSLPWSRRRFVRTSGGLFVASLVGCDPTRTDLDAPTGADVPGLDAPTRDVPTEPADAGSDGGASDTPGARLVPLFFSDFGTALGTANPARGDGGKWDLLGGHGQEVVASAGLDFPSANTCRFVAHRDNSGFALSRHTGLPPLAVGSTRAYRWYVRMTFPDALVGNGDHPWQDGNAVGDCNFIVGVHYGSDVGAARAGQWQLGATFLTDPNGFYDNGPWLDKNRTYRVECLLARLTDTTYDFDFRVYDGETLAFTSADFPADFGGTTIETGGPWMFRDPANLDGFNCGTNDFETAGNDWWLDTFEYSYQGCFAICDDQGWIGPYGSVEGEG